MKDKEFILLTLGLVLISSGSAMSPMVLLGQPWIWVLPVVIITGIVVLCKWVRTFIK